jgi:hypothetical protein
MHMAAISVKPEQLPSRFRFGVQEQRATNIAIAGRTGKHSAIQ